MATRKWINGQFTKDLVYWTCPGKKCLAVDWYKDKPVEPICCSRCGTKYQVLQFQKEINRILIEVEE